MTAKLNRVVRCSAAVLAVIAVGAGATACNSSTDSDAKSSASQESAAGKKDSGEEAAEKAGIDVKKTAAEGSRTDAINSKSASASKRCHTGELKFGWGMPGGGRPDMDADQQQNVGIKLTNAGGRTCTLRGFPGVRLISDSGEAWDLRRSSVKPATLTLKPGEDTAMVSMNILPVAEDSDAADTKPFVPSKVLVTPPDETTHVTLDWPHGGAILDQSGATRPGTFVDPIVIG